ncbi:hypothetical protein IPG41_02645 [Candidatus Peregrinibacteria bacterium]|nr:MAG: hypothetical protein IPG41_02645 [Candidatus Peregrinibacteria bacterium]
MKALLATLLLATVLCACSKIESVKNETTEAVDNLQNEAFDFKNDLDKTVDEVNSAVDSVGDAVDSVNKAVNDVKAVTH